MFSPRALARLFGCGRCRSTDKRREAPSTERTRRGQVSPEAQLQQHTAGSRSRTTVASPTSAQSWISPIIQGAGRMLVPRAQDDDYRNGAGVWPAPVARGLHGTGSPPHALSPCVSPNRDSRTSTPNTSPANSRNNSLRRLQKMLSDKLVPTAATEYNSSRSGRSGRAQDAPMAAPPGLVPDGPDPGALVNDLNCSMHWLSLPDSTDAAQPGWAQMAPSQPAPSQPAPMLNRGARPQPPALLSPV